MALTVQRRVILETVAGRTDHPTADQVYDAVTQVIRGVSRTTVYRVLEAFVRMGVVTKVSNPRAKTRFDADTSRHHHLICLSCDTVIDCRNVGLDLPDVVIEGFMVKDLSVTITGVCAGCSTREAGS